MTLRTVIVSLIVGVVVTLVAALVPALRATRVTPMAALRESELQDTKPRSRVVTVVALVVGFAGLAMMLIGLFGGIEDSGSAAGLLGGGAALMLFGVSLFSPRLVRPLASLTGRPLERLRGLTGRLARENAMRKPGRTATTAAALMIGLALVVFVTIFAAGLKTSVAKTIDESFRGEIVLQNSDGFSPIPREAVTRAGEIDGVDTVSSITYATGALPDGGQNVRVAAVDPATLGSVLALTFTERRPLGAGRTRAARRDRGRELRSRSGAQGGRHAAPAHAARANGHASGCVGTVEGELDLLGKAIVDESATRQFGRLQPSFALARLAPDASPKQVQDEMDAELKEDFPTVEVQNQSQLKDQQEEQVNSLLGLVYALLSLAVIVSLFGIVNTLALSIHERTRELGMLRAVGMSRRQVRTMVRYEAVITALIGAILGTVLGVIFAVLVSRPLADEGFKLSYPVGTLLTLLVLAALAGVVAAIGPARRASRLDVLRALAYE